MKIGSIAGAPLEVFKYLVTNVSGKFAAVVVALFSLVYLFAPEFHGALGAFLGRLQWSLLMWLVVLIFWRGLRRDQMLTSILATQVINDPNIPLNVSPDPAVNREIKSQIRESHGAIPIVKEGP